MSDIKDTRFIADDAVKDEDILLDNGDWLRGRNAADSADIFMMRIDTSDRQQIGLGQTTLLCGAKFASDPGSGTKGEYYFNVTSNEFRYHNGTSWGSWGSGSGGGDAWSDPVDSSIVPDTAHSYNIGSEALGFHKMYLSTTASFHNYIDFDFGSNSVGAITHNDIAPASGAVYRLGIFTNDVNYDLFLGTQEERADVRIETGDCSSSQASGSLLVETGENTSTGVSGDINLKTGATASGVRGGVLVDARVLRLPSHASAPASPVAGDMYFDTTTNKSNTYDGTSWQAHW